VFRPKSKPSLMAAVKLGIGDYNIILVFEKCFKMSIVSYLSDYLPQQYAVVRTVHC